MKGHTIVTFSAGSGARPLPFLQQELTTPAQFRRQLKDLPDAPRARLMAPHPITTLDRVRGETGQGPGSAVTATVGTIEASSLTAPDGLVNFQPVGSGQLWTTVKIPCADGCSLRR
ncbi:hypothetical protein [Kitasatospora purpeofusca]|uniref:hypothetical protein n=1 Tax=Kitasatospora purpeofusca TaxID=67352 RepID=UPI00365AB057